MSSQHNTFMPPPTRTLSLKDSTAFTSFITNLRILVDSLESVETISKNLEDFTNAAVAVLNEYYHTDSTMNFASDDLRATDVEDLQTIVEEEGLFDVTEQERLEGSPSHYECCVADTTIPKDVVEKLKRSNDQYRAIVPTHAAERDVAMYVKVKRGRSGGKGHK
jgi:hypothetical protein